VPHNLLEINDLHPILVNLCRLEVIVEVIICLNRNVGIFIISLYRFIYYDFSLY
jgi:hypothetical protein